MKPIDVTDYLSEGYKAGDVLFNPYQPRSTARMAFDIGHALSKANLGRPSRAVTTKGEALIVYFHGGEGHPRRIEWNDGSPSWT